VTVALGVFALAVLTQTLLLIKIDVWLFVAALLVVGWGWWAALAPRRLRAPLPPSVDVLTPLRAADDPRLEALLALAGIACVVTASMLQFAALYGA
jgi:hypothetical protein